MRVGVLVRAWEDWVLPDDESLVERVEACATRVGSFKAGWALASLRVVLTNGKSVGCTQTSRKRC